MEIERRLLLKDITGHRLNVGLDYLMVGWRGEAACSYVTIKRLFFSPSTCARASVQAEVCKLLKSPSLVCFFFFLVLIFKVICL